MDVQNRHDRSLMSLVLQTLLRPLRPRLASPNKTFPAGSNKLDPHEKIFRTVDVRERRQDDIYVYDISPKSGKSTSTTSTTRRRMYYFAGGGWQMPPSSQHWKFCAELVNKVPGLVVSIVSHPLAPNAPAAVTLPQLNNFYASVLEQGAQAGEQIMLGGDSSGGNLVLSLALQRLMRDVGGGPYPVALLLISPAVELRPMEAKGPIIKPSIKDPVLTIHSHNGEAEGWCQQSDRSDVSISPIMADMSLLAKAGVKVIGVTGGYDILTPDALKLRDKCQQSNVQGAWLQWEKQMHCFPLTFMYHLPEGVMSKDWVVERLKII